MMRFVHFPKAAMIAAAVALGGLAYAPAAQAFGHAGGFHGGGFHGGGFHGGHWGGYGGWGGWGYPYAAVGWGYAPYYGAYDDYGDAGVCTLRRVHVHTAHGWRWRTYQYC